MNTAIQLEDGENILYTARKHWYIFACEVFFLAVLSVVPAIVVFMPSSLSEALFQALRFSGNGYGLFLFIWSIWLLLVWVITVTFWTDYYLDVWFVTSHRVIDVEQRGLFNRSVSSFRLDQIQDATVEVSGLLATLINFGTVSIRTASEGIFKFKGVSMPNRLKETIMSEHHRVLEVKR